MWYFDNLGAYKSAAHGYAAGVEKGHKKMESSLQHIRERAELLRNLSEAELKAGVTAEQWNSGAYTDYNREHN